MDREDGIRVKKCGFGLFSNFDSVGSQWSIQFREGKYFHPGGLFASVGQMGFGFGFSISPNFCLYDDDVKPPYNNLYMKYVPSLQSVHVNGVSEQEAVVMKKKKKQKGDFELKLKIWNSSLRRLFSGEIGNCNDGFNGGGLGLGNLKNDGWNWKGLFKGNFGNVIPVALTKTHELLVDDTFNKNLSARPVERPNIPFSDSLLAGPCSGVSSILCAYPLELLKTRLTIQRGVYDGLLDAFVKILREEGPAELYKRPCALFDWSDSISRHELLCLRHIEKSLLENFRAGSSHE